MNEQELMKLDDNLYLIKQEEMVNQTTNDAIDAPDKRDYTFEDYIKMKQSSEEAEAANVKWPRDKVIVQDQGQTKGCTFFGATHIHNGLNILEDERYGKTREQDKAMDFWNIFCKARGYTNGGASIQDSANRLRKNNYIAGYVTIPNTTPLEKMIAQMKTAIDMGGFIYGGSAFGAWSKIGKTGIYEESNPKVFLGHGYGVATSYVLKDDGVTVDYFWAINSYGPKRGPYGGYFKIMAQDVDKLYSKLIFIDFDDKVVFAKFQEVEKLKQAIGLLREVYAVADAPVKEYFDKIQIGQNLTKLYNTTI